MYDHLADLQVGQCFDPLRDKDDQIILAASLKPCDEPHLAEITGQRVLPGAAGTPYPGGEQVADASERECLDAFSEYVGIEYDLSRLQAEYSFPGTETWPGGDRQVTCFVTGTEIGPLTRSVKGSSQ